MAPAASTVGDEITADHQRMPRSAAHFLFLSRWYGSSELRT
jgi:hypothetical protein